VRPDGVFVGVVHVSRSLGIQIPVRKRLMRVVEDSESESDGEEQEVVAPVREEGSP